MKPNSTQNADRRIWVELSSGKESDWRVILPIVVRAFQNDPMYRYTHPDPVKRRLFLRKYFDYLYEGGLKNFGLLAFIKMAISKNDKEGKVIGGLAVITSWFDKAENYIDDIKAVDEEGWKRNEMRDDWEYENIHAKMARLADYLGTSYTAGVFHVIDEDYTGLGIGTEVMHNGVKILRDEAYRREIMSGKQNPKPVLDYCLCDHARSRNFCRKAGFIEVAQLRYHQAGVKEESNDSVSYVWVFIFPPEDHAWVNVVRREFNYSAKL